MPNFWPGTPGVCGSSELLIQWVPATFSGKRRSLIKRQTLFQSIPYIVGQVAWWIHGMGMYIYNDSDSISLHDSERSFQARFAIATSAHAQFVFRQMSLLLNAWAIFRQMSLLLNAWAITRVLTKRWNSGLNCSVSLHRGFGGGRRWGFRLIPCRCSVML